jgi:hypothetical protein
MSGFHRSVAAFLECASSTVCKKTRCLEVSSDICELEAHPLQVSESTAESKALANVTGSGGECRSEHPAAHSADKYSCEVNSLHRSAEAFPSWHK